MPGLRYVFTVEAGTSTAAQVMNAHQDRAKTCQSIMNLFAGIDAGNWRAGRVEVAQGAGVPGVLPLGVAASATVNYNSSSGAQTISVTAPATTATGTITISGGAGTVGATIGGTLVTVTWATSDNATASALAAAIRSNGTVNQFAFATNTNNVVNVSALGSGAVGKGISLVASGTGVTVSGASLTGGSSTTTTVSFNAGATDAATVQNAIAAIHANLPMLGLVFVPTVPNYGAAINTGGLLTLWANTIPVANTLGNGMGITSSGTGAGTASPTFAGGVNSGPNGFNV